MLNYKYVPHFQANHSYKNIFSGNLYYFNDLCMFLPFFAHYHYDKGPSYFSITGILKYLLINIQSGRIPRFEHNHSFIKSSFCRQNRVHLIVIFELPSCYQCQLGICPPNGNKNIDRKFKHRVQTLLFFFKNYHIANSKVLK